MAEWTEIVGTILGSTVVTGAITGAVAWIAKNKRDDQLRKETKAEEDRKALIDNLKTQWTEAVAEAKSMRAKSDSLLADAVAREREMIEQLKKRIDMDAKQDSTIDANSAVMAENTRLLAELRAELANLRKGQ